MTIFICLSCLLLSGQVDSLSFLQQAEMLWENAGELSDDIDYGGEEVLEVMEETGGTHNLNSLSYETASRVLGLTDYQYYQLQLYIEVSGPLVSVYELAAIEGFTQEDVGRLLPRVVAEAVPVRQSFWRNFWKRSQSTLMVRDSWVLERQAGYDTTRERHYEGSRDHLCFRYTFNSQDKIILKFSGEKDAGEPFFRGKQRYGFDFYAGSLAFKNMGALRQAVIGDYRLSYGQGLVLGSALMSGRGGDISQLRSFSTGIRAVAPTNEGDFLRGAAATVGNSTWQGTLFGGQRFGTNRVATGGNIAYTHKHFRLGGRVVCQLLYDTCAPRPPGQPLLTFEGLNASIDYQTTIRNMLLFGETAATQRGAFAILQGLTIPLTAVTHLGIILRHYSIGYEAPLGKAFGALSQNSGESGLYLSLQHILSRRVEFKSYVDFYHLHTPTYRLESPAQAMDAGAALVCNLSRSSHWTLSYQFRDKPVNTTELHYKRLREQQSHRIRFLWEYKPHPNVTCKSGIVYKATFYNQPKEHFSGLLLYQNLAVSCWKDRFTIHARIAYFDTQRYDERLYAYEDDVYYAFTIGSYYYKGMRGYLVLRFHYRFFSLWVRIGQTFYLDRQVISSGLSQIDQPHKTELRVQTLWQW